MTTGKLVAIFPWWWRAYLWAATRLLGGAYRLGWRPRNWDALAERIAKPVTDRVKIAVR